MSDYEKAKRTCIDYLELRTRIRAQLLAYAGLGMRAQCVEQSRTIGFSYERVDEDVSVPSVSDPTGNAAGRTDPMLVLLAELDRAEVKLITACDRLIGHPLITHQDQLIQVLRLYRDGDEVTNRAVKDAAKVMQRAMSHTIDVNTEPVPGLSADGAEGCGSCSRLKVNGRPWWNDANYRDGTPTDLGGLLKAKLKLCRACKTFIVEQEPSRLPSIDELRQRHDHPRGHWPKRYVAAKT